ncbi:MAG: 50S ribosomal protein L18 [Candidatus Falkowbacteria bacterium]
MNKEKIKQYQRGRRVGRIRAKISGTKERPRLSVFRSNKGMYLQLINDLDGKTLVSAYSNEIKKKDNKTSISFELGKIIAKKAKDAKISSATFDRGGYKYHGRIKAVADGAREEGLQF